MKRKVFAIISILIIIGLLRSISIGWSEEEPKVECIKKDDSGNCIVEVVTTKSAQDAIQRLNAVGKAKSEINFLIDEGSIPKETIPAILNAFQEVEDASQGGIDFNQLFISPPYPTVLLRRDGVQNLVWDDKHKLYKSEWATTVPVGYPKTYRPEPGYVSMDLLNGIIESLIATVPLPENLIPKVEFKSSDGHYINSEVTFFFVDKEVFNIDIIVAGGKFPIPQIMGRSELGIPADIVIADWYLLDVISQWGLAYHERTVIHEILHSLGFMHDVIEAPPFSEQYPGLTTAAINALRVTYPPVPPVKKGDVDEDGEITTADALRVLRNAIGGPIKFSKQQKEAAEVSGDDKITVNDALLIFRYAVGLIAQFPVETHETQMAEAEEVSITKDIEELEKVSLTREQKQVLYQFKQLLHIPLARTTLLQNFPNPFNPETWIPFQLAGDADVSISIYNAKGHLVRKMDLGSREAGSYLNKERAAYWDGRNDNGDKVSSGVYFYTLRAGNFAATRRMVIIK